MSILCVGWVHVNVRAKPICKVMFDHIWLIVKQTLVVLFNSI